MRDFAALVGIPIYFYYGDFYLVFKAAMDTFFLVLILAVLAEGARRAVRKPAILSEPPSAEDAGQSREPARLLVSDADDGAGRPIPA